MAISLTLYITRLGSTVGYTLLNTETKTKSVLKTVISYAKTYGNDNNTTIFVNFRDIRLIDTYNPFVRQTQYLLGTGRQR